MKNRGGLSLKERLELAAVVVPTLRQVRAKDGAPTAWRCYPKAGPPALKPVTLETQQLLPQMP